MTIREKMTLYVEGQAIPDPTECVAVPGAGHIIDVINPLTDRTAIYGRTLEDVRAEPGNEGAERMTIAAYCQAKAARQDAPVQWDEITEERYNDLLECLPPALYLSGGFLVGEPSDHHALTGEPRYQACVRIGQTFKTSSRPMTRREFAALNGYELKKS